jgi:hypothetical protein
MQPQHFTTNIFEQFGQVPAGIVPIAMSINMESGGTIYWKNGKEKLNGLALK